MPMNWKGAAFQAKAHRVVEANLDRAAMFLAKEITVSVSHQGTMPEGWTPQNPYKQYRDRDDKDKGLRTVGAAAQWLKQSHSKPGEPPYRQTGALSRSIRVESPSTYKRRVGVLRSIKYALWLELGTRAGGIIRPKTGKALYWPGAAHPVASVNHKGMAARPYLKPALRKHMAKIQLMLRGKA